MVDRVAGEFLVIIGHEPHLPEDVFGHRHDERPIAFGARGAAPSGVVWAVNERPSLVRTLLLCAPPSRARGEQPVLTCHFLLFYLMNPSWTTPMDE